jgi:hypothetical protein
MTTRLLFIALFFTASVASAQIATPPQPGAPQSLIDSAENAEVTYDAAKSGNWTEATARLDQLRRSAASYPTLKGVAATLAGPEQSHDRLRSMKIANEITRQANEMLRNYPTPAPVDIAILDYEGRKLEIGTAEKSLSSLKKTTKQIRQTWNGVRPQLESRGGTSESKAFELLVAQLENTNTIPAYGRIATSILAEVDRLEAVFTR